MGVWKQRLAKLSYILCPAWSIFTPVGILTIFDYFCQSGAIDVVKILWSSFGECSGMFVTKVFPGRCCGVAAVSKRLFKAPETVVILISNLHFWSGVISRRDQVALFGIVSTSGVITCSFIVHFHRAPSERLVHQLFYNMILSIEKVSRFVKVVFIKWFVFWLSECFFPRSLCPTN